MHWVSEDMNNICQYRVKHQQQFNDELLSALCLPVDIVSKEQVVGTWWIPTFVKMSQQVLVLAVNVATYVNRSTKLNKHRLREKYVARQHAQLTNVCLR